MDTQVSTPQGPPFVMLGPRKRSQGLKKLAKVRGRSTIGYQHHHQAENSDSQRRTESELKTSPISELQRNVTPHLSEKSEKTKTTKTYSQVKKMAMRFDKTDPGRNSVENTENYGRQPHTEDSTSYVLHEVLKDRQNEQIKYLFKFDEESLPVFTRSTSSRRQPSIENQKTSNGRQPAAQKESKKETLDMKGAARQEDQKENLNCTSKGVQKKN